MGIQTIPSGSFIIPMDITYQDTGMFLAYGLVINLLKNNIPIKWAISDTKSFSGTDFTATTVDYITSASNGSHNYSGGPFIIDVADTTNASPFINTWLSTYPQTKVHKATANFSANINYTLIRPPRISMEDTNSGIVFDYMDAANILDSTGIPWNNNSPGILTSDDIGNGAMFGYNNTDPCKQLIYDIFISPHTSDSTWTNALNATQLALFGQIGGDMHAMCHSISAIENFAGPFLTQSGISDFPNKGDTGTFTVVNPPYAGVQAVNTSPAKPQVLPGGSEQTWLTTDVVYNSNTDIQAFFTNKGLQYDLMISGPFKNGIGAGRITYEGGHSYSTNVPYSTNSEGPYLRFFYNSLLLSVAKPRITLTQIPQNLPASSTSTVLFTVSNTGGSDALNADLVIQLSSFANYNLNASIAPSSISPDGKTLTWSQAALNGHTSPGVILTFTANVTPTATGYQSVATYTSHYSDMYSTPFTANYCVSINAAAGANPLITKIPLSTSSSPNLPVSWTIVAGNTGVLRLNNVVLIDTLPDKVIFVSSTPPPTTTSIVGTQTTLRWVSPNIPTSIPSGGSFTVVVNSLLPPATSLQGNNIATLYGSDTVPSTHVVSASASLISTNSPPTVNILTPLDGSIVCKSVLITWDGEDHDLDPLTYNLYYSNNNGLTYTTIVAGITTSSYTWNTAVLPTGTYIIKVEVTDGDLTSSNTANNIYIDNTPPTTTIVNPLDGEILSISPVDIQAIANDNVVVKNVLFEYSSDGVVYNTIGVDSTPSGGNLFSYNWEFSGFPNGNYVLRVTATDSCANTSSDSINVILDTTPPIIDAIKSTNKPFVGIGETSTISLDITNSGTLTAENVIVVDTLPVSISYVPNTFRIDGGLVAGDPTVGINIGNLIKNQNVLVTFDIIVNSIPSPNPFLNTATLSYSYNNGSGPVSATDSTNTIPIEVKLATLNMVKSSNKTNVTLGDTITYAVTITNSGNTTAQNVFFKDTIPNGSNFVNQSVFLNGINNILLNPQIGINVPDIGIGGFATVAFKILVVTIPSPNQIINNAVSNFNYVVDPQNPPVSSGSTSNTTQNNVFSANLNMNKSSDKPFVDIGDQITYTITIANTENATAQNVIFKDTIPTGTSFVSNSVIVSGTPIGGANPQVGVNIGNINPLSSANVIFKVLVNTIPPGGLISNSALTNYSLLLNVGQPTVARSNISNIVTSTVANVNLSALKGVNKTTAKLGDTLIYAITITNSGNTTAQNVIFKDTIPTGTSFVTNSVFVNGVNQPGQNPQAGVNLLNIAPSQSKVVNFSVKIGNTLPLSNSVLNIGNANFSYIVNPQNPPVTQSTSTNTVTTSIDTSPPVIDAVKSSSKEFVDIGDITTISVTITNSGSLSADTLIFKDALPSAMSYVTNTFRVNGGLFAGDPTVGVNIGNLFLNSSVVVTFNVLINSIPNPNPFINTATMNYTYNQGLGPISASQITNEVPIEVKHVILDMVKTTDKTNVSIGDYITYTIVVTNNGSAIAENVVLTDPIFEGLDFVAGSVSINGFTDVAANPILGINLNSINIGDTKTVSFIVEVISIPTQNPTENIAFTNFEYVVDPNNPSKQGSAQSNTVENEIVEANILITKNLDRQFATIGDEITYTIVLKNTGNVAAQNVLFIDTIPSGTSFVHDSVKVDSVTIPGLNPQTGISFASISPNISHTISFKATVETIPSDSFVENMALVNYSYILNSGEPPISRSGISNEVSTEILNANITINKAVDKQYVQLGDNITYTINVTNIGNTQASSVIIYDTIPNGTSFINNSVSIDNVNKPGLNPLSGIDVSPLNPNQAKVVKFKVLTIETIPFNKLLPNSSTADFKYIVDPNEDPREVLVNSNTVITNVNQAVLDIMKSVNKQYAEVGDTITYSLDVTNLGSVNANNVFISDIIPSELNFVSNSVSIDGTHIPGITPSSISLGTLIPNQSKIIEFDAIITTLPNNFIANNVASGNYNYLVNPSGQPVSDNTTSNITTTSIVESIVETTKSSTQSTVSIGDEITYTVTVQNSGNVTIQNVIFTDTLSSNVEIVQGSFSVNGNIYSPVNLDTGVNIGDIAPNKKDIVVYKVKVISVPDDNLVNNTAIINYEYVVDPNDPKISKDQSTNEVSVNVINIDVKISKLVDKTFADINEELNYTITVENLSNVPINNILVSDTLDKDATYVPNSLTLNGFPIPNSNPFNGVYINTMQANDIAIIAFKAIALTIPADSIVENISSVKFYYYNGISQAQGNEVSNVTETEIKNATIEVLKAVNTDVAVKGQILRYSITLINKGNTPASNVILTDLLDPGLTFVDNSLSINGINQPGININQPISLGIIDPNTIITIEFNALVADLQLYQEVDNKAIVNYEYTVDPNNPPIQKTSQSNNVITTVVDDIPIHSFKNKDRCLINSKKCICSNSCEQVDNSEFNYDIFGACTPQDLIAINKQIAISKSWTERDIYDYINIDISSGNIDMINYISVSLNIIRQRVINTPGLVPISNYENKYITSRKVIVESELEINIEYMSNDTVSTYSHKKLFSSFIVVDNSYNENISVDGCVEDLSIIDICNNIITVKGSIILYVSQGDCDNTSNSNGNYYVNEVASCGNLSNFLTSKDNLWNEFFIETLSCPNDICSIISIKASITTIDKKIITTPSTTQNNYENLSLTGKKLVVSMILKLVISYTDTSSNPKTKALNIPYSDYIMLPNDKFICNNFDIIYCIEDIFAACTNNCLFINTTILMKAKKFIPCK